MNIEPQDRNSMRALSRDGFATRRALRGSEPSAPKNATPDFADPPRSHRALGLAFHAPFRGNFLCRCIFHAVRRDRHCPLCGGREVAVIPPSRHEMRP